MDLDNWARIAYENKIVMGTKIRMALNSRDGDRKEITGYFLTYFMDTKGESISYSQSDFYGNIDKIKNPSRDIRIIRLSEISDIL